MTRDKKKQVKTYAVVNDSAEVVNVSYNHDSADVVNVSYNHDSVGVVNESYNHDSADVVNVSYNHDSADVVNVSYNHDSAGVVNESYNHDSAGVVDKGFSHYARPSGKVCDTFIELTVYKERGQPDHTTDPRQESSLNVWEGSTRSTESLPAQEAKNTVVGETLGHTADDGVSGCAGVWLIALGASICMLFAGMVVPCFGILFSPLLLELGASSATVGWIFSIMLFVWHSSGLVVGSLVEEFGWRKVAMMASFFGSCSFVLSAFATSTTFLFFSLSIMGGLSWGSLLNMCYFIVPHYFSGRKGVANGCVISALSLGPMIAPVLIGILHKAFGYTGGTLVFGAVMLHGCVGASFLRPIQGKYNSSVQDDDSNAKSSGAETVENKGKCRMLVRVLQRTIGNLSTLKSPPAAIIAMGGMFTFNSCMNFVSIMPFAMQAAGHTNEAAGWCLTVGSIACLVATITASLLSDRPRFNMRAYYMTSVSLAAASTVVFSVLDDYRWQVAMMGVWGCSLGVINSLYNLLTLHYVGLEKMMSAMGSMMLLVGTGFVIFGPSIGMIRDATGSYAVSMWVCAGLAAITVALWAFMPAAVRYDQKKSSNSQLRPQEVQ
nr:monocarboxylate transporter 12-like [Procambarus clarkii]